MFQNPIQEKKVTLNPCITCEHCHPSSCGVCKLAPAASNDDPWANWGTGMKEAKKNVASGEDAYAHI